MSWWRRHWRLGLALVATGLGLVLVLLLYALRKKAQAEALQVQLGLMNASMKVAGLEADRTARTNELVANQAAADDLDLQILVAKRQTVDVVQKADKLTDAEVEAEFRRLGY